MLGTRYGPQRLDFSDCRNPIFSDFRDPMFNSRDSNRVSKTLKKMIKLLIRSKTTEITANSFVHLIYMSLRRQSTYLLTEPALKAENTMWPVSQNAHPYWCWPSALASLAWQSCASIALSLPVVADWTAFSAVIFVHKFAKIFRILLPAQYFVGLWRFCMVKYCARDWDIHLLVSIQKLPMSNEKSHIYCKYDYKSFIINCQLGMGCSEMIRPRPSVDSFSLVCILFAKKFCCERRLEKNCCAAFGSCCYFNLF